MVKICNRILGNEWRVDASSFELPYFPPEILTDAPTIDEVYMRPSDF
jgi:hypothetical protein